MIPGFTGLNQLIRVGLSLTGIGTVCSVNTANVRAGFLFVAPVGAGNMTGFFTGCGPAGGTLTGIGLAQLYAVGSNFRPTGSALATVTFTPVSNGPATLSWGTSVALTAGTVYAVVMSNQDAAPATNFYSVNVQAGYDVPLDRILLYSTDVAFAYNMAGSHSQNFPGWPIYATLGNYGALSAVVGGGGSTVNPLYNVSGSRVARVALRVNFTKPVRLWRILANVSKTGTPAFDLKSEVIQAGSVIATSDDLWNAANMATPASWHWANPVDLSANTDYYVAITPVGATAGDASNYATLQGTNVNVMRPGQNGPAIDTYISTGATISWSQTTIHLLYMQLMVEAKAGGGIIGVNMNGGIRG